MYQWLGVLRTHKSSRKVLRAFVTAKLFHYFDIDFEIVGAVLENDLDTLGKTVALMLAELPNNKQQ